MNQDTAAQQTSDQLQPSGSGAQDPFATPAITLPKGGGAIKGMGEKFGVNPVNGSSSLTIPIHATPGRSKFTPNLALSYNSGAGNGPFGFGWRLSIPSITRKTDKGLPRYFDAEESDVFILSDAEDLVPLLIQNNGQWTPDIRSGSYNGQSYNVKRYRPRIEGLFARIECWRNDSTGDTFWKSISKDNIVSLYGTDSSSRIADPDDPRRVFSWLLDVSYDDVGNVIQYQYKAEDNAQTPNAVYEQHRRITANRYPKTVKYGNSTPYQPAQNLALPQEWYFSLVFDYGEHDPDQPTSTEIQDWRCRPDPFSSYRSCFEVRTYRLCQRVLMFHHFPAEFPSAPNPNEILARSTDFRYSRDDTPPDPLSPIYTYLESAQLIGYQIPQGATSYSKKSLPPVEMHYTKTELDPNLHEADSSLLENLPIGVDGGRYQWVDLDGEGSPGVLSDQAGSWFYRRNISNLPDRDGRTRARFEAEELIAVLPEPADLNSGAQQLMDLAGDGKLSLVRFAAPMAGYFERTEDHSWQRFEAFESVPNIDWRDPNLRSVDLNGDGFPDVLITENEVLTWYPSRSKAGFGPAQTWRKPFDEDDGPAVIFADGTQSIYLADMSGDGQHDLLRVRNGEICYWPNLGYGRFGAKITMEAAPVFDAPDQFEQKRLRLADIDGSGTTDIIYLGRDAVRFWLNQSGNGWSEPQALAQFPATPLASVGVVDLLGKGTVCLVWSSPLPGDTDRPLRYIELMKQKPHLLVNVKNNLGAETRVHYCASTKFYLEDRANGQPWVTRLAFPVHVVERVESFDWVSRNRFVSRYSYHHGYFDGIEREFRGFGRVDQLDAEEIGALTGASGFPAAANVNTESYVPPVLTKTWYHTGAYPLRDRVSRVYAHEYYQEPGLSAAQLAALQLPDTVLPDGLRGGEIREAIRSLKGAVLRQEIYALDGTPQAAMPYSVSEKNYTVNFLQPFAGNRHTVFFTHARESVDFHYERKLYPILGRQLADPRVTHNLVLAVDAFGNELESVAIGYGRRYAAQVNDPLLTQDDRNRQSAIQATYTLSSYTNHLDTLDAPNLATDVYRTPLPAEVQTYELIHVDLSANADNPAALFAFADLQAYANQAGDGNHDIPYEDIQAAQASNSKEIYRRLLADTQTYYLKDDLSNWLALGTLEAKGLPYQTYKLAYTAGLLSGIYPSNLSYLPALSALQAEGGYIDVNNNRDWWLPSGQLLYSTPVSQTVASAMAPNPPPTAPPSPFPQDAGFAAAHFYLPQAHLDQFGEFSLLSYDNYDLLLTGAQDALGNTVNAVNDYRVMQPIQVTDPNGNYTQAAYDTLGLLMATAVMGKNGEGDSLPANLTDIDQAQLDAFVANPADSTAADLLGTATTRLIYDYDRFAQQSSPAAGPIFPVYAAVIAREIHVSALADNQQSPLQIGFSFSDGFGREIQRKAQAEPDPAIPAQPRWLASGWTIFNNKGKPVRQYEPFYSASSDFEYGVAVGVSPILLYDPLVRVVATVHPDQSWEKVIFDPWRQESWDGNDTSTIDWSASQSQHNPAIDPDVGEYFLRLPVSDYLPTWYDNNSNSADPNAQSAAAKTSAHANTPTISYFDSLGRAFLSIADNGPASSPPASQVYFTTRTNLDIQGYQRSVTDAKGRLVMLYDYTLLGGKIHQSSMEAGQRWLLNDVLNKPIRHWDSRGHAFRTEYDALRRPLSNHVRGNDPVNSDPRTGNGEVLYERIVYGENYASLNLNLRGKVYMQMDMAGVVTNSGGYDFKGNLLGADRQLTQIAAVPLPNTYQQLPALQDFSALDSLPLEADVFSTSTTYDALNRPVTLTTPDANITAYSYNKTKLLKAVAVILGGVNTPIVSDIQYNAKGQRTQIDYGVKYTGNDPQYQNYTVSTLYTYDPATFRLLSLTTTGTPNGPAGPIFQALSYYYDPVGNITHIEDNAQHTIYFSNTVVTPTADYTYDPIYRLTQAMGREHLGQTNGVLNPATSQSYNDQGRVNLPSPGDGMAMGNYTESYVYDEVGNFQFIKHCTSSASKPDWTRSYFYQESSQLDATNTLYSNRLSSTTVAGVNETYSTGGNGYDPHGNMLSLPNLPRMVWDFKDQLLMTQQQLLKNAPAPETCYLYDAGGQRVRKINFNAQFQKVNERIYLGGYEVYREYSPPANPDQPQNVSLERQTLHVMDDKQRVALVETLTQGADGSPKQSLRYQFGNHLGSSCLELDGGANVISYEEYYPYGCTAYQAMGQNVSAAAKRYRFTGKERDEESGFNYHGARYYAGWFGRWVSCDPKGMVDGTNIYLYVKTNPVSFIDPNGTFLLEVIPLTVLVVGACFIIAWSQTPLYQEQTKKLFNTLISKLATDPMPEKIPPLADSSSKPESLSLQVHEKPRETISPVQTENPNLLHQKNDTELHQAKHTVRMAKKHGEQEEKEKKPISPGSSADEEEGQNNRPPNLATPDADRETALKDVIKAVNKAEDRNIDINSQPDQIDPNPKEKDSEILRFLDVEKGDEVRIRNDYGGHDYGEGDVQNRGPHFNYGDGHYDYNEPGKPYNPNTHYDPRF